MAASRTEGFPWPLSQTTIRPFSYVSWSGTSCLFLVEQAFYPHPVFCVIMTTLGGRYSLVKRSVPKEHRFAAKFAGVITPPTHQAAYTGASKGFMDFFMDG